MIQQHIKPMPTSAQAQPKAALSESLALPLPKVSGPSPRVVLEPEQQPKQSSWRVRSEEEAAPSRFGWASFTRAWFSRLRSRMGPSTLPLKQKVVHILNYFDDWLIMTQLRDEQCTQKSLLLSHLECMGFILNLAKSLLSPWQRMALLCAVLDMAQMHAHLLKIQWLSESFKSEISGTAMCYFEDRDNCLSIGESIFIHIK